MANPDLVDLDNLANFWWSEAENGESLLNPSAKQALYHTLLDMGEEMRNLVEMLYLLLGIFSVYCVV